MLASFPKVPKMFFSFYVIVLSVCAVLWALLPELK